MYDDIGARMHSYSGDGANCATDATAAAVPTRVARIEVQVVGEVRVRRTLRGRPVVAVRAGIADVVIPAVARRWQENAIKVYLARELVTFDTI